MRAYFRARMVISRAHILAVMWWNTRRWYRMYTCKWCLQCVNRSNFEIAWKWMAWKWMALLLVLWIQRVKTGGYYKFIQHPIKVYLAITSKIMNVVWCTPVIIVANHALMHYVLLMDLNALTWQVRCFFIHCRINSVLARWVISLDKDKYVALRKCNIYDIDDINIELTKIWMNFIIYQIMFLFIFVWRKMRTCLLADKIKVSTQLAW